MEVVVADRFCPQKLSTLCGGNFGSLQGWHLCQGCVRLAMCQDVGKPVRVFDLNVLFKLGTVAEIGLPTTVKYMHVLAPNCFHFQSK